MLSPRTNRVRHCFYADVTNNSDLDFLRSKYSEYFNGAGFYNAIRPQFQVKFIRIPALSKRKIYPINKEEHNEYYYIYVYILDPNADDHRSKSLTYGRPENFVTISNLKMKVEIASRIEELRKLLVISNAFDVVNFNVPDYMNVDILMTDSGVSLPDYINQIISRYDNYAKQKREFIGKYNTEFSFAANKIMFKPGNMGAKLTTFNYFIKDKIGYSVWDKMSQSEKELLFAEVKKDKEFCEYYSVNFIDDLHDRGLF